MKKILLLTLIGLTLIGCTTEDDNYWYHGPKDTSAMGTVTLLPSPPNPPNPPQPVYPSTGHNIVISCDKGLRRIIVSDKDVFCRDQTSVGFYASSGTYIQASGNGSMSLTVDDASPYIKYGSLDYYVP